jgi:hypothetical protein
MTWKTEHTHRNVVTVHINAQARVDWEQHVLLRTDAHHDNPHCKQDLEKKHLDQARERNAIVIDNGDLFCAMQGKYDKRSSKDSIRPEHQNGCYLDSLVSTAADFYRPYADLFAVLALGNHETAIIKSHETNLTDRLAAELRRDGKSNVLASGYGGWVRFAFDFGKCKFRQAKLLHHYHGSGGGGPVTKGVIQTNRMIGVHPDSDIVFTGHTHDEWIFPIQRMRVSSHGVPYQDEQLHVRAPGYKDAWDDGFGGFEVERMHQPRPTGAIWLKFGYQDESKHDRRRVTIDVSRAK